MDGRTVTNSQIMAVLQAMQTSQMQQLEENKRTAEALAEIQRTLRGFNGTPGMVTQLSNLEAKVGRLETSENDCEVHEIATLVKGDGKTPGLSDKVRQLEALAASLKWVAITVGGAFLVWTVTTVLTWWPKVAALVEK